ncbi:hypothetical protein ACCT20_37975, partial [Rhizobium ruizarguesonis]
MASVFTSAETDRPKWTVLQRASLITLPVALFCAVMLWLIFFTLIYDAYIFSFGSVSYFDYVGQVRFVEALR